MKSSWRNIWDCREKEINEVYSAMGILKDTSIIGDLNVTGNVSGGGVFLLIMLSNMAEMNLNDIDYINQVD